MPQVSLTDQLLRHNNQAVLQLQHILYPIVQLFRYLQDMDLIHCDGNRHASLSHRDRSDQDSRLYDQVLPLRQHQQHILQTDVGGLFWLPAH